MPTAPSAVAAHRAPANGGVGLRPHRPRPASEWLAQAGPGTRRAERPESATGVADPSRPERASPVRARRQRADEPTPVAAVPAAPYFSAARIA